MNIPVYTKDNELFQDVKSVFEQCAARLNVHQITLSQTIATNLTITLPFCSIVDNAFVDSEQGIFSEDAKKSLMRYRQIIILLVNDEEFEQRDTYMERYPFVISILQKTEVKKRLDAILTLFEANPHILLNLEIQALISSSITSKFVLLGIYRAIPFVCSAIIRLIAMLGLVEKAQIEPMHLTLLELLSNAIEHGNFEISFADKRKWLDEHSDISGLIEQKMENPKFAKRYSTLEMSIFAKHIHFQITDMGKGFDWQAYKKNIRANQKEPAQHGYGIAMSLQYAKNLKYNDVGNSVSFDMPINTARIKRDTPEFFAQNNPRITLKKGEVLIRERDDGDTTDFAEQKVYFVIDGSLKIMKKKKKIGMLFAHDVFCGELGYLLQAPRTVTLIADSETRLIVLAQGTFAHLLHNHDFCKVLVMQVLANRLTRVTERISGKGKG